LELYSDSGAIIDFHDSYDDVSDFTFRVGASSNGFYLMSQFKIATLGTLKSTPSSQFNIDTMTSDTYTGGISRDATINATGGMNSFTGTPPWGAGVGTSDWSGIINHINNNVTNSTSSNAFQVYFGTGTGQIWVRNRAISWGAWKLITDSDTGWLNLPLANGVSGTATYRIVNEQLYVKLYNLTGFNGVGTTNGIVSNLPFNVANTGYFVGNIGNAAVSVAITDDNQIYVYQTLSGTFTATDKLRLSFNWTIS
jgi:hypothetical protein